MGKLKFARRRPEVTPPDEELSIGREDLNAMVHRICHVNITCRVRHHAVRGVKLAVGGAHPAPLHQIFSIGGEFLDTMIHGVGNIQLARAVHGNVCGHVKLTGLLAVRADSLHDISQLVHLYNAVVPRVGHIDVAGGV